MKKEPGNVFSVAALIYGLGHAGRKKEAKRHLDQLLRKYDYVPCWFMAMAWVGLNDRERALEAFRRAMSRSRSGLATGRSLKTAVSGTRRWRLASSRSNMA